LGFGNAGHFWITAVYRLFGVGAVVPGWV
jgi:hypothetical protein